MKHWIASIFFLASVNLAIACGGWYPYGEEIRFSLFDPSLMDDGGMGEFYYSADYFSDAYLHTAYDDRNVDDWYATCAGKVTKEDVFEAVYRLSTLEIVDKHSAHPFVKQMISSGKSAHLEYLAFAKKYSYLNTVSSDPWERKEDDLENARESAMKSALKKAKKANDDILKRRYAFVAIRFAFYNKDFISVNTIYEEFFSNTSELTIDLWAHYYQLHDELNSAERNFIVAQLFAKIPSKRHGLFFMFDRKFAPDDVLNYARNDSERANVLAMYALRTRNRQLNEIIKIHQFDANNALFSFLLVRELNKLEDWVLAPKYTAFAPVMLPGNTNTRISSSSELIKKGVIADQVYARKFLVWLKSIESSVDPDLFATTSGLLYFICDDAKEALNVLNQSNFKDKRLVHWKQRMVELLKIASDQTKGIEALNVNFLLKENYKHRDRFVFVIGRLFEFRKDLGNAALFYSQLNMDSRNWQWFAWSEPKGRTVFNVSFYTDYFDYFDANYKAKDVQNILDYAKELNKISKFEKLSAEIIDDNLHLLDLIGTKYLRQNELVNSIVTLKTIPTSYWNSKGTHYAVYLSSNPFYANFYSEHNKTEGDTVSYTKLEIVEKLHEMLQDAKTQQGNELAKTYFHIANCYFNMTTHGNSWMMRRSWWSTYSYNTVYEDSDEFNKCELAKSYYLKAAKASTTPEFDALCYRMAGRCESYKLYFDHEYNYKIDYQSQGGYREYIFNKNSYYKILAKEFPQWRDELVTNCNSFNRFYHSI
ncbi:MAG: hypothetical protein MK105_06295 [Crocinitomicaceae bacterium]|nr:hypothetical protein [Crocinitomicaceae bacterium]